MLLSITQLLFFFGEKRTSITAGPDLFFKIDNLLKPDENLN